MLTVLLVTLTAGSFCAGHAPVNEAETVTQIMRSEAIKGTPRFAWTTDARYLAVAAGGTVRVLDTIARKEIAAGHSDATVTTLTFAESRGEEAPKLVVGYQDGVVQIRSLRPFDKVAEHIYGFPLIGGVATRSGTMLLANMGGSEPGHRWAEFDLQSWKEVCSYDDTAGRFSSASDADEPVLFPDGMRFLAGSPPLVFTIGASTGSPVPGIAATGMPTRPCMAPSGETVAEKYYGPTKLHGSVLYNAILVRLIRLSNGLMKKSFEFGPKDEVAYVATIGFCAENKLLLYCQTHVPLESSRRPKGQLRVLDTVSEEVTILVNSSELYGSASVSPGGRFVAALGKDAIVVYEIPEKVRNGPRPATK